MSRKRYLIIGENDSRRVQLFKETVAMRGEDEPRVVSYLDLISGSQRLDQLIESGDFVRLESPGKEFEVERALLRLGVGEYRGFLSESEVDELSFDRGLILPQSQWYRGWCKVLNLISGQLAESRPHVLMNSPDEIAVLFDKVGCQARLEDSGVRMPLALGTVASYEELLALMKAHHCQRVFLKPAHSSSASGIVAYQSSQDKHLAVSTVELASSGNGVRLYNSRRVRTYSTYEEIRTLVDALSVHNLFVQKWYPKASINKRVFDLRVVVVAGKSRHVVVRESKTPFTNLHLLNTRGQLSVVRNAIGEKCYADTLATCEKTAQAFPKCLYIGVDVLISSNFKSHAVAEANAFGDLLPGVLCDGLSTYEYELEALDKFVGELSGALHV